MKNTVTQLSAKAVAVHAVALTAVDASAVEGAAGNWIMLMPAGVFSGRRTGRGPFDTGGVAEMTAIIERTLQRAGGTEIVVDYDHQTIFAATPGVGGRAPAAGWIKEFEVRDDGLWGRVEWTAAAAAHIRAGEYRYISPTFYAPKETGKVLLLLSAALTNTPDLDLTVVAASALLSTETETPDMKSIAKALGLPEDANEADILAAVNALLSSNSGMVAASGAAKPEDAIATIMTMRTSAGKVDPALYVPIAQVTAMQADINTLKSASAGEKAEADVSQAIADGKIQPALKDWALDLHKSNISAFNAFLAKAPVLTMSQRTATVIPPNAGEAVLSDADLQVMSQMGISREDMLKAKKDMEARN
jgi:phage I-like protein